MEALAQHGKNEAFLGRLAKIIKIVGGNSEAARITGKSEPTIGRYKKGGEIPFDSILKLADAANVSV